MARYSEIVEMLREGAEIVKSNLAAGEVYDWYDNCLATQWAKEKGLSHWRPINFSALQRTVSSLVTEGATPDYSICYALNDEDIGQEIPASLINLPRWPVRIETLDSPEAGVFFTNIDAVADFLENRS